MKLDTTRLPLPEIVELFSLIHPRLVFISIGDAGRLWSPGGFRPAGYLPSPLMNTANNADTKTLPSH